MIFRPVLRPTLRSPPLTIIRREQPYTQPAYTLGVLLAQLFRSNVAGIQLCYAFLNGIR